MTIEELFIDGFRVGLAEVAGVWRWWVSQTPTSRVLGAGSADTRDEAIEAAREWAARRMG